MPQHTGEVGVVYSKAGKFGGMMYSIKTENSDIWFSCGNSAPTYADGSEVQKGDVVTIDFSVNGKGRSVVESVALVAGAAGGNGTADTSVPAASGSVATGGARQDKIAWQAARNSAIELLKIQQLEGILDIGSGAKGKKAEALGIQLNKLTLEFYQDTQRVGAGEDPADWEDE